MCVPEKNIGPAVVITVVLIVRPQEPWIFPFSSIIKGRKSKKKHEAERKDILTIKYYINMYKIVIMILIF